MTYSTLIEVQPNRDPYLFLERIIEVIPLETSMNEIYMKPDKWFFKCHWQGDPNMPAMLQLEAMTQTASLCLFSLKNPPTKLYLVNISNASFRKKIVPGMTILVKSTQIRVLSNIYTYKAIIREKGTNTLISKAKFDLFWPGQND